MCKKGNTTLQLGPTSNNQPSLTLLIFDPVDFDLFEGQ